MDALEDAFLGSPCYASQIWPRAPAEIGLDRRYSPPNRLHTQSGASATTDMMMKFKRFAMRRNVVDVAVGTIIGRTLAVRDLSYPLDRFFVIGGCGDEPVPANAPLVRDTSFPGPNWPKWRLRTNTVRFVTVQLIRKGIDNEIIQACAAPDRRNPRKGHSEATTAPSTDARRALGAAGVAGRRSLHGL